MTLLACHNLTRKTTLNQGTTSLFVVLTKPVYFVLIHGWVTIRVRNVTIQLLYIKE